MATIRKRGGRWQVQIRRQGHAPVSRTFAKKSDADAWARLTEQRLDQTAAPVDLRSLDKTTFGDLLRRYRSEVTVRKRGALYEGYRLDQMLRHPMAELPLSRLCGATFAAYRDERLKTVSGETVRREMTILRHVIQVARQEWDVPLLDNPVSLVKRPKPNRPRDRRPTAEEIEKLIGLARRSRTPLLAEAIILAMETGLRRSELLAIEWRHVDLSRRILAVPLTKTGEPRTIPLTPTAVETLRKLPWSNGRLFSLRAEGLRRAWERLCTRAGIVDLHWHDWRHEALSRFFEMGLSLPEVAAISGHKEPRMLMRYTHLRAENLAMKLSAICGGSVSNTALAA